MNDWWRFSPVIHVSRGEHVTFQWDDDTGGLLVLGRITRSIVSIYYWYLQFLNTIIIIIIKTNVDLPHKATLSHFGHLV